MLAKNEYLKALPIESESLDNYITLHYRLDSHWFALNIRLIIIVHNTVSYWTSTEIFPMWNISSYCIVFVWLSRNLEYFHTNYFFKILLLQEVSIDYRLPFLFLHLCMGLMPLLPLTFILTICYYTLLTLMSFPSIWNFL